MLWLAICLAQKMGKGVGRGQVLLGSMQNGIQAEVKK
jgi:hypothetical protein